MSEFNDIIDDIEKEVEKTMTTEKTENGFLSKTKGWVKNHGKAIAVTAATVVGVVATSIIVNRSLRTASGPVIDGVKDMVDDVTDAAMTFTEEA